MSNVPFQNDFLSPKLIPTKPGFGIPDLRKIPVLKNKKTGILLHDPKTDIWEIDGMPQLCQSDPLLDVPMDKLIATIPAEKLPLKRNADGTVLTVNEKPVRYTALEMREALKGYGCYNTSIVVVMIAALANRATDLKDALQNRTKVFDEIKKSSASITKEISQLAWHYYQFLLYACDRDNNDPNSATQPHYFHEVVADIGKGIIKEVDKNPYIYGSCTEATLTNGDAKAFRYFYPFAGTKPLNNERIIELMKAGTVPMIAYNRHKPHLLQRAGAKMNNGYSFKDVGDYHKVVFCGFQPGKYPLRIIDVASGNKFSVRISSDLNEIKFDFSNKFRDADNFDKKFVNRPFLVCEGEEKNNPILFIDHYDGLNIRNGVKL